MSEILKWIILKLSLLPSIKKLRPKRILKAKFKSPKWLPIMPTKAVNSFEKS